MEDQRLKRVRELEAIIAHNSSLYFQGDANLSDEKFDKLVEELRELDPENEILKDLNTGGDIEGEKEHGFLVLGLNKYYDKPKSAPGSKRVMITPKLDGVSAILYYSRGKIEKIMTRGDGHKGSDITHLFASKVAPSLKDLRFRGAIRGELVISKSNFQRIKEISNYKNARNTVAGLLSKKEYSKEEKDLLKLIDFLPYEIYSGTGYFREAQGSKTSQYVMKKIGGLEALEVENNEEILEGFYKHWSEVLKYEIDGIVVSHLDEGDNLEFIYARKYNNLGTWSEVIDIEWKRSNLNKYSPVAIIKPIELGGVTIRRVALMSYQNVCKNEIQIGSQVRVIRSGEVIPKIEEVRNFSTWREENICRPDNSRLEGAHLIVSEISKREAEIAKLERFFLSLKIKGIGGKIARKFAEAWVDRAEEKGEEDALNHFLKHRKDYSIELLSNYEASLMSELKLMKLPYTKIMIIKAGEGINISKIRDFLDSNPDKKKKWLRELSRVQELENDLDSEERKFNYSVCLSSKFTMSKRDFEQKLNALGVGVLTSLTNADALISSSLESSKAKRAREKRIPIYSEKEFLERVEEIKGGK